MKSDHVFTFDQLVVGQEWVSAARVVTSDHLQDFADMTGDHSPIHVDPEYAATTPFRQCIAHGILGMALGSGLSIQAPAVRTIAFLGIREWRFLGPIFIGDEIHVVRRVMEKKARGVGRRGEVVWSIEVRNQKNEVVQRGITETLVEGNLAARRPSRSAGEVDQNQQLKTEASFA